MTLSCSLFIACVISTGWLVSVDAKPVVTPVLVDDDIENVIASQACTTLHGLLSIRHQGRELQLDDGSRWQVDAVQALDTVSWSPTDPIVACHTELTDMAEHQLVHARQVQSGHEMSDPVLSNDR